MAASCLARPFAASAAASPLDWRNPRLEIIPPLCPEGALLQHAGLLEIARPHEAERGGIDVLAKRLIDLLSGQRRDARLQVRVELHGSTEAFPIQQSGGERAVLRSSDHLLIE